MLVRLTTRMDFVMTQWFISDLHLGHINVLKFRSQFQTIDQHDKHIVNSILSTVKPKDTLWILGDVILHAYSMHYLRQISDNVGRLKIVLGNHDGARRAAPTLNDLSRVARLYTYTTVGRDDKLLLSHVPVDPCNLIHQQKWNIHGHCHNGYEPTNQHINVTCEKLDYKPISLKQIERLTYLTSTRKKTMNENILFGKTNCPQCVIMKNYLDEIGLSYNYVDATLNMELFNKYAPGVRSVPQFVYQGKLIGDVRQVMKAVGNGDIDV